MVGWWENSQSTTPPFVEHLKKNVPKFWGDKNLKAWFCPHSSLPALTTFLKATEVHVSGNLPMVTTPQMKVTEHTTVRVNDMPVGGPRVQASLPVCRFPASLPPPIP